MTPEERTEIAARQHVWLERLKFWALGMTVEDSDVIVDSAKYRKEAAQHLKSFARWFKF